MTDEQFAALTDAEHAALLAEVMQAAVDRDGLTLGSTDMALAAAALRAYAANLAAI